MQRILQEDAPTTQKLAKKIVIVMEILKLQKEINQEMMNVINFS